MKILIASDKFKGSLSAIEACNAMQKGILDFNPLLETIELPLADGGEGSLEVLERVLKFEKINIKVTGPRFEQVKAYYGLKNGVAYIEMAKASGLLLLKEELRHAPSTTTLGTGELILDAMKRGATKIFLFVGGSATNDAGIGMAHALGYRFLDNEGAELSPIGNSLMKIASISGNPYKKIKNTEFILVSDVTNPLYGKNGAAKIFAKQKGANDAEIEKLDKGLKHFAEIMETNFKIAISYIKGGGAAGGLGAGAVLFLRAKIRKGIETIMDIINFDKYIQNIDFVISGEGKFDSQTLEGKVIKGVIDKCIKFNKFVGIVCGISELSLKDIGTETVMFISPIVNASTDKDVALNNAFNLLSARTKELMIALFDK